MASKRPPAAPSRLPAGRRLAFPLGVPGVGGLPGCTVGSVTVEEPFYFHDVVDSMYDFLQQCHYTEQPKGWIEARIIDVIRDDIYKDDLCGMAARVARNLEPLTPSQLETIFHKILRYADECSFYDAPMPAVIAPPPVLGGLLPLVRSTSGGMGSGSVLFSSPARVPPSDVRFLPVLTPERSVIGLAEQRSNDDIMNSLVCHMLYAPQTCVDPLLYNFISWLFELSPDYMHAHMINPAVAANATTGMQKSFGIFLSQVCGQLMRDGALEIPLIWHKEGLDTRGVFDLDRCIAFIKLRVFSSRHFATYEDTWLNTLMGFVDMFVQKDRAIRFAQNSFASLAMKILGFYCFQHVTNLSATLKPQFNHSCFVEIYGRNNALAKKDLLQEVKNCRLPAWLLIPFDPENATRVARRLMIRIHQYRVLLHDNILGAQCEWCRREARSLYTQLHGYVDMLIQTFIAGDPVRHDLSRRKLQAVFDRINSYVDRLMKLPGCPSLIGRAYEELIFIAMKIAEVLHIPQVDHSFAGCFIIKDDHIQMVLNEREGPGDDGEGGHIFLDPRIQGAFWKHIFLDPTTRVSSWSATPFRYHLHNSINIQEDAAVYKNNLVIGDFRPEVGDPATGVLAVNWVMSEKKPGMYAMLGIPEVPGTLVEVMGGAKRATLFPRCYSPNILGYCQRLCNVVQACEQRRLLVGQPDSEGCCVLARLERQVLDITLAPGEKLFNRMYILQHPHIYGCVESGCPLRGSEKPIIVAMYAWHKEIQVGVSSAVVSMEKIASMYPLMYFDQRCGEALPVVVPPPPVVPLPVVVPPPPAVVPPVVIPPLAVTPPPPTATPVLPPATGLSPDGIDLRCGTELFRLNKQGAWFEKKP